MQIQSAVYEAPAVPHIFGVTQRFGELPLSASYFSKASRASPPTVSAFKGVGRFKDSAESPNLTRNDVDLSYERRIQPLPTEDGAQIAYPFGTRRIAPRTIQGYQDFWDSYKSEYERLFPGIPFQIGELLGQGGQHMVYGSGPDEVLRFGGNGNKIAECMLVLQAVLEHFGIPHLCLRDDEPALDLAAKFGVTCQSRLPKGALNLDEIVRGGWDKRWGDVLERVMELHGQEAKSGLESILERIHVVNQDPVLKAEAYRRGYTVADGMWSDGTLNNSALIDHTGGEFWGNNLYYHPDYGWFLGDW